MITPTDMLSVSRFVNMYKQPFDEDLWSRRVAKKRGLTQAEILSEWKAKADTACAKGNDLHAKVEAWLNGNKTVKLPPIVMEVLADSTPVLWEHRISDPDVRLRGQFDYLGKRGDDYILVDWKTNTEIKTESRYGSMLAPFDRYDDCNFNHYSLQQSLYAILIEWHLGFKISEALIVHENGTLGKIYPVGLDMWKQLIFPILQSRLIDNDIGF